MIFCVTKFTVTPGASSKPCLLPLVRIAMGLTDGCIIRRLIILLFKNGIYIAMRYLTEITHSNKTLKLLKKYR